MLILEMSEYLIVIWNEKVDLFQHIKLLSIQVSQFQLQLCTVEPLLMDTIHFTTLQYNRRILWSLAIQFCHIKGTTSVQLYNTIISLLSIYIHTQSVHTYIQCLADTKPNIDFFIVLNMMCILSNILDQFLYCHCNLMFSNSKYVVTYIS